MSRPLKEIKRKTTDEKSAEHPSSSDAYKRNSTHDPDADGHVQSSDAYERNETHDPTTPDTPQSSDAYERNLDSSLTRDQITPVDEEE